MPLGHDLEAFGARIGPATRLVFIANPNNPVGTWLGVRELRGFLESLPERVIAVVDEAYFEYSRDVDCADASRWIAGLPNLVVTRTFSKAYGLAGLRVGYALSHPDVADLLNRVRQPFNVNSLALAAAEAALDDAAHLAASVELNRAGLAEMRRGLTRLGLAVLPSAANFLLADFGRPVAPVYEGLLREGVIVRPVAGYGLPNALRITVGTAAENARCLAALARVLGVAL
jgi:histidinol-phosphate aminotransferase